MKKIKNKHGEGAPPAPTNAEGPKHVGHGGPYVVGIGASAGGLEAFEQFFARLPANTGMSFVLVQHLEPTHKGMMPELLARHTKMPVVQAKDGIAVEPNRVYVIPPNADLSILHHKLHVLEPAAPRGLRAPIDFFFRYLAADQKDRAIGIILSGMGSDGTLGLRAIKEQFGVVLVQDPASAKYDGMPRSAIGTGLVDFVAPAQDLPAKLIQFAAHPAHAPSPSDVPAEEPANDLAKVFVLLRAHSGNDFSCYKKSTIDRRLERRLAVHQFGSLSRYVRFLSENPQEVETLYKELLIGVTNFFRDSAVFDYLKQHAVSVLLKARTVQGPLRVWNPGCSTGEESYSLAIALHEGLEALKLQDTPGIQIFATDIDPDAIDTARRGTFPAGIANDVSPERLERFFVPNDGGYRVKKEIREAVVFATQNILIDPPFTKLDLLCCRNLLIYLNVETQKKLVPLMHYALNPGGLLILGTAESTGSFHRLFSPLDSKRKIYQCRSLPTRDRIEMPVPRMPPETANTPLTQEPHAMETDLSYFAQRALLDLYGPPSVVVNAEGDILYLNGRTGKYLEPASGKVNSNVFAMARDGLREDLHIALHWAATHKAPVTRNGIKVKTNGGYTTINLAVRLLSEPASVCGLLMVVFEEQPADTPAANEIASETHAAIPSSQLESELLRTRERLQITIEEMQATQEELRSTNEELQSNNEELQSTNEELNSSKEELQSLNEEMQTVNAELQSKMEELSQSNNDMMNLLNGIDIATLFLDNELCVKRFTPQIAQIVNLVASDVGRPLEHFATKLKHDGLVADAGAVLDRLTPKTMQVETDAGLWYNMRILPYRTTDNVIDGVVLTFADITPTKRLEESLRQQQTAAQTARDFAENIVATIREPLVVLDAEMRIISASRAFYLTFQTTPAKTERQSLYDIDRRQWDIPALRQLLGDILHKNTDLQDYRVELDFAHIGRRVFLLNAHRMVGDDRQSPSILLAMEDITARTPTETT